jgi:hypothetical protein
MVASHQREPGLLGTVSVVINGAIDTSLCGPLPVVVTKAARSLGWATMNEVLAGLRTVGFALRRVFFAMVTSYLNNGVTPERVSTSSCGEGKATPHQLMAQFPNHLVKVGMPRSWISCFIEMVGPEKCPSLDRLVKGGYLVGRPTDRSSVQYRITQRGRDAIVEHDF